MNAAFVFCAALAGAAAQLQEYSPLMTTFGHAIKNGALPPGKTVTAFEHNCTAPPCQVTQIHVPSVYPNPGDWENAVLTFEMDGEAVELTLLELVLEGERGASGGKDMNGGPWGTEYFGKTAKSGAVYSTIRVPFQKTFKLSIRAAPEVTHQSIYWLIVRGVEAYRVVVGDVLLPADAKLKVDRFKRQPVHNLQFIPMATFAPGHDGVLFGTMFSAESPDYTYLEACVRLVDASGGVTFLSSGAEDYFLSASYFDEGMFKTENAGLTYFDSKGSVSAYKVHNKDLVFTSGGGNLTFRVGESTGGCGSMAQCPNVFCRPGEAAPLHSAAAKTSKLGVSANVTYTTLVMRYEWASQKASTTLSKDAVVPRLFAAVQHGHLTADVAAQAAAIPCPSHRCTRLQQALETCGSMCFDATGGGAEVVTAKMIRSLVEV